MLISNLYAHGVDFSGVITGHSLVRQQQNKGKDKNPFYSGITHTFFKICAAKTIGSNFEGGYCGIINPTLFPLGYVFQNNYMWFRWNPYGEFRAGNSYGLDVEWCTPVQKLVGMDGFVDEFYHNHSGYYAGLKSVASSEFAAKGTWISPLWQYGKNKFRIGFSWAPNTTYKGFRFAIAEKDEINYKGYLPINYVNIWFGNNVKLLCSDHITIAGQYKVEFPQTIIELAAAYLFGQSQVHERHDKDKKHALNDSHGYVLSGLITYKNLTMATEFYNNGTGKLPKTNLEGLTLRNAHKGTSGKALNLGMKLSVSPKNHFCIGYQYTWSYLTDTALSERQLLTACIMRDFSENMAFFIKAGWIESSIDANVVQKIKAQFPGQDIQGANHGWFVGTGMTVRFGDNV